MSIKEVSLERMEAIKMRIDAYMRVNQLYNTNKTNGAAKTDKASKRDALEISSFGSAYHVAKTAVADGTPVRESKVQEIKAQMEAGTYKVSIEDVADKLADKLLG